MSNDEKNLAVDGDGDAGGFFKFWRRSNEGDEERKRLRRGARGDVDKDEDKGSTNPVVRWSVSVKDEFERLARAGRERWKEREREREREKV